MLLPFSGYVIKRLRTPSELIARAQVPLARQTGAAIQKSAQKTAVKRFANEEASRRNREQVLNATREVVKRLGIIDGYVRVLEGETDPARRTVTFQAAHQEITEIAAKRASGEIPPQVMNSADILDQARSTSEHLARLGLEDDRLNRDITQVFNGFLAIDLPPETSDKDRLHTLFEMGSKTAATLKPHAEKLGEGITVRVKQAAGQGDQVIVREILTRLATVDSLLRVIEFEPDPAKRLPAFQSAHVELTALEKQRATGKISDDILDKPDIVGHARATSAHLVQLGLAGDRLNLEIVRVFNLRA